MEEQNPLEPHKNYHTAPPLPGTGEAGPRLKPHKSISASDEARHRESVARFPELSLSPGEFVVETVRRHPIGIISIWAIVSFLVLVVLSLLPLYSFNQQMIAQIFMTDIAKLPSAAVLTVPALILAAFFGLGGLIATIVYEGNRFYLTNESVVQHVQTSLFNTKQQVVNLINVEDASSTQEGIIEQILNYGTLRLSTQGEETIYHFRFVYNPRRVVHTINDAVEIAVKKLEGYPANEF